MGFLGMKPCGHTGFHTSDVFPNLFRCLLSTCIHSCPHRSPAIPGRAELHHLRGRSVGGQERWDQDLVYGNVDYYFNHTTTYFAATS